LLFDNDTARAQPVGGYTILMLCYFTII